MIFAALNRCRYSILSSPSLDNFVFKLCYRWTVVLLVVFSFVVTCRLALGDSFVCAANDNFRQQSYLEAKCYADSAYISMAKFKTEDSVLDHDHDKTTRRYQSYYSWVNLLFLVHAFNFYLPHLLWKSFESGCIYKLTAGVQKNFDKEEKRGLELCNLAKYVLMSQGKHKFYTFLYILFEVCNFSISLAQTVWLVYFFDVTGVPDSLTFTLDTWSEFQQFYFPQTGLCDVKKKGASGDTQLVSVMCEMPLNRLFMMLFLFLQTWYIFITILTGMVIIYRIVLLVPPFRMFLTKISINFAELSVLKYLCNMMSYSDWFFLSRLRKSMTDVDFAQMLDKIVNVSQCKAEQRDMEISSACEERMKEFECSDTSPL